MIGFTDFLLAFFIALAVIQKYNYIVLKSENECLKRENDFLKKRSEGNA